MAASLHKPPGGMRSAGRSGRGTLLKRQDWSGYHCMLAWDLGHLKQTFGTSLYPYLCRGKWHVPHTAPQGVNIRDVHVIEKLSPERLNGYSLARATQPDPSAESSWGRRWN